MATKPLTERTTEELKKMRITIMTLIGMMAGMGMVFLVLLIYRYVTGGWDTVSATGIPILSMLGIIGALNGANLSKINAEIRKREERV
jgi:hypothetical protein